MYGQPEADVQSRPPPKSRTRLNVHCRAPRTSIEVIGARSLNRPSDPPSPRSFGINRPAIWPPGTRSTSTKLSAVRPQHDLCRSASTYWPIGLNILADRPQHISATRPQQAIGHSPPQSDIELKLSAVRLHLNQNWIQSFQPIKFNQSTTPWSKQIGLLIWPSGLNKHSAKAGAHHPTVWPPRSSRHRPSGRITQDVCPGRVPRPNVHPFNQTGLTVQYRATLQGRPDSNVRPGAQKGPSAHCDRSPKPDGRPSFQPIVIGPLSDPLKFVKTYCRTLRPLLEKNPSPYL
ncbi:hypothetical protein LR48_Vigan1529s000700 [Vigna angularis]|uniref:Uncharacterized protein n=1 Tax=Phaseolus angularis TaxID=3914 RepID=A0A0L9TJW7_PHAAN|nr:hypothetical protein LR48_Vigan1529s000700 [Vigna angularis]